MVVFKYIEDKDVFQKFYSKYLAKRLIYHLSASDDVESAMISKLKSSCGFEYTAKLQRMYQDISTSKNLNEAFQLSLATAPLNVDFTIQVLTNGSWPLSTVQAFNVPTELEQSIQRFTNFYSTRHVGRKLTWLYQMCRGEIRSNHFDRNYTFTTTTYQMAVLLMFNQQDEYTLAQLVENTHIKKEFVVQIVQALVKSRLLQMVDDGLMDEEEGKQGEDETNLGQRVRIVDTFSNPRLKIDLSKIVMKSEVKQETETVQKNVEEDRKLQIQAAIVRIMKMRKRLNHQALMTEVMTQLGNRFKPKVPMIKKCIDILMEKEYIRRVEGERDQYEYLA